jgi:rhamnosyl/mannosyltransferase
VRAAVHGHFNSQPLTLNLAALIRREISRQDPQLVHLHLPNPLAAAAWLALERSGTVRLPPLAVWYHADITRQRLGRLLVQPVVGACLKTAAGIAVSSTTLKENSPVLAPWENKVEVIPFGIDPHPWSNITALLDGPFLFVGRLVPYKGLDVLMKAMGLVSEASLVIIGDGPLAAELACLADQVGCAGRVQFTGPMGQEGVASQLARARALLLPSVDASETFGLVQLEAMAAGVPVIATDLATGVREVGSPGTTCRLVRPGDPEALGEAMESMWSDRESAAQMGRAGRLRFSELYTRDIMVDRLMDWYATLIPANSGESS